MAINPFLKENKKPQEPIKIVVSERFADEKGNPVPFVLEIPSSEEADRLSDTCLKPVMDATGKRKIGAEVDQKKLQHELLVISIKEPDLTNKETQDSWGVKTPSALLTAMLDMKEKATLIREFDKHFKSSEQESEESEEETKNI